ncbi:MAG: aldehyde dehydrogenase family protein [Phycisphaerales bacterium]|nr:aldehyde dehydrogenase family protein [Phycisphaerales bacterium]
MQALLKRLGLSADKPNAAGFAGEWVGSGETYDVTTPIDGTRIAAVAQVSEAEYEQIISRAHEAFKTWRMTPAPVRGEVVRQLGERLRAVKAELGMLVTLEMGKILPEGEGEVQEMIDICDFACGLSRQLYGLTMHSERPRHRMYEQWHPLGVVGIISAFNFPVAVWAWNSAVAAVCGDTTVWKPAPKTPLTAIACIRIAEQVCRDNNVDPAVFSLAHGPVDPIGERMIRDERIPLISATGSCAMGRHVGQVVAQRMGRTILELGGNNAIIVTPFADLDLATRAILFGSVGTAGQRCTSTRRVIAHQSVRDEVIKRLKSAYESVPIGDPRKPGTLMGPVVDNNAITKMTKAIQAVKAGGGKVHYGGDALSGPDYPGGLYVRPCIAEVDSKLDIVRDETFAPLLYVMGYGSGASSVSQAQALKDLEAAIETQNNVPQGLSSAIFSTNMLEVETFLSHAGSDCGIANANIGTSGAEIGGAFGGEKETGGGRESGSDSWKAYMRRQTNTINWSVDLPLAQGIQFG